MIVTMSLSNIQGTHKPLVGSPNLPLGTQFGTTQSIQLERCK
jgi:hypothetical protein